MNILIKSGKWLVTVLLVLFLAIYFVRAFDSRNLPEPAPEHRIVFDSEFDASREQDTDWQGYLEIEERMAKELADHITSTPREQNPVDRYSAESLTSPENFSQNWNRSYEMRAVSPRGVAVLLHGLSDSPYSMRSTAEVLAAAGYNVVVPRIPGHGFAVGGLRQVRWQDWNAAVRVAIRHALTLPGSEKGFFVVGYSNGGLAAVDYGLSCGDIDDLPCPEGIILLSPAISVSPFAAVANLHSAVSWMPYFERFQWQSVLPEIDPFKFTSFPKHAGWEIHKMSAHVHEMLEQPGAADKLPPILAFQSVVDNTIQAAALVEILFSRLPANGSELVVYDVNRTNATMHVVKSVPVDPIAYFEALVPTNYAVTVLLNSGPTSLDVDAWHLDANAEKGERTATTLRWPAQIYSLSHIALPFRPDDPVYGAGAFGEDGQSTGIALGALAPRGERGILQLSADYFMRTRYNPFFAYQAERLLTWLETP
jgi:alpha-beta hydrolase superfamily lysophospholipase